MRTSVRRAALATASLTALVVAVPAIAQAPVTPAPVAAPPAASPAVPASMPEGGASPPVSTVVPAAETTPPAATPADPAAAVPSTAAPQRPADIEAAAEASPQLQPTAAQATAAAVSTFMLADLDRRELRSTRGIGDFVPNMVETSAPGVGSANVYTLRGLGNAETAPGFAPAVGTFIDGIYLAPASANNFGLFDLDRIDVLRGPQSVLLGRETAAGAIDVKLRQPGDKLAGYIEGGYGAFALGEVRASIDIPLGRILSVKLSGYHQSDAGYVRDRITGQRNNDSDAAGLRGATRLQLTDRLSWNTSLAYMRDDAENLLNFTCDPAQPALCNGRFASTGLLKDYNAAHPSPLAMLGVTGRKANFGLQNYTDTLLYTSNLEWRGDTIKLNLITGVVDFKQRFALDFADSRAGFPGNGQVLPPAAGYPVGYVRANDSGTREFSQNVRLSGTLFGGGLDYAVGGSYYEQHDRADVADVQNLGGPGAGTPVLLADRRVYTDLRSIAGYAQLDVHPVAALTVTGGVRYTDRQLNLAVADNRARCAVTLPAADCFDAGNLVTANGSMIPTSQTSRRWLPRVVVSYQLPGVLLFASASRGLQAGGWETRSLTPGGLLPYASEQLWSYEAGGKSELFDHRLQANLRGFWIDASNDQVSTATLTAGLPAYATQNVGLRSRGAELELKAKPVARVSLFADFGYQHATYRGGTALLATPDARPVRSPNVTLSGGAAYDYPIPAAGIILEPTANVSYRSSYDLDSATLLGAPATRVSGYALVNAALMMKTDDNNWTLSVECANCLDKAAGQSALLGYTYLNAPRTWLVRARRVF